MRFLGIDPGLNRTGYALLDRSPQGPRVCEGGIIKSTASLSLAERVREIGVGVREVIEQFQPGKMAMEQVFSTPKHPRSALLMAHARGVILFVAAEAGLEVEQLAPRRIKLLLTGSGKASKEQMQQAVRSELGLAEILEPHDVADAFAVALCQYYSSRGLPESAAS